MAQILVFGASTAYGVGGSQGGWPDLLKQKLHDDMYVSEKLPAEKHEAYNLCVPGTKIADIKTRFTTEIDGYSKPGRGQVVIIELGGNDAKATTTPNNFVNSPEKFSQEIKELINLAKTRADHVVLIGLQPVDETKTAPRTNPHHGGKSYFLNERMELFEKVIKNVASETESMYVPIFEQAKKLNWQQEYLFDDGLHPNSKGHQWLFDQIWPVIKDKI